MKSEHRHELETNTLAKWLADFIARYRDFGTTALAAIAVIVVVVLGYGYVSESTSSRQSEAWNEFNDAMIRAVSTRPSVQQSLEALKQSAEAYPDTATQEWADVTWADGQVLLGSWDYVHNRQGAMESVNKAMSTYQSLLEETENPEITSRSHFGLGRVYELRNELDEARKQYASVQGPLSEVAKQRIAQLEKPAVKESYEWLASAVAPRSRAPGGIGQPAQRPGFGEDPLDLPAAKGEAVSPTAVEDLFKGIGTVEGGSERYDAGEQSPPSTDAPSEPPAEDTSK